MNSEKERIHQNETSFKLAVCAGPGISTIERPEIQKMLQTLLLSCCYCHQYENSTFVRNPLKKVVPSFAFTLELQFHEVKFPEINKTVDVVLVFRIRAFCFGKPKLEHGVGNCRGADKSLARPWKETSYSDQDLQHYTKTYGVQTTAIYSCCLYAIISWYSAVSLGRSSLFPSSVGLRTY